ncbi:hypothetical protein [Corallococcus exiguus]|uniref:hypothetical protein n=1 Tax=Corallococcus exiguus TaxID=83462 RepID=UPI001494163E|nr:hypothetical protein [Corallococcus exiguus]NPD22046.1 hypothetical protein [Corallococcus exiguus]
MDDEIKDVQSDIGITLKKTAGYKSGHYTEFVSTVAQANRTEILKAISRVLWHIWNHNAPPQGRESEYELCRAYLSRIAAIAAGKSQATGGEENIGERILIELAGRFSAITESITDDNFFTQEELPRFENAIKNHEIFKHGILDQAFIRGHAARLTIIRIMRSQWDFRGVQPKGLLRAWDIANRLDDWHELQILPRLRRNLNIELKDFLRAGFAILTAGNSATPGFITENFLRCDSEVANKLNLDKDALLLVADRMSRSFNEFLNWNNEVVAQFPDPYRKYASHPLVSSPLIRLDSTFEDLAADERAFLCPSASHLLWRIQSSAIDSICNLKYADEIDIRADLGEAISEYLFDFLVLTCGKENVIDLDEIYGDKKRKKGKRNNQKKHADYVVMAGTLAIVIESKTSIGSSLAKSIASPEEVVDAWSRIYSAYRQCAHTINGDIWTKNAVLAKAKQFVSIVCFDELICPEGAAFNDYAVASGIWKDLNIGCAEVMSLQELEDFTSRLGPAQLGFLIQAKWFRKKHAAMFHSFISGENVKLGPPRADHLRPASEALFPGFKMF